jgi:hypothetical protein
MEHNKLEVTVKRLRVYMALLYFLVLYGSYCMYMHEYLIMKHLNQPIRRWFFDVWFGIGPLSKLYMVISLYITLHLLVVGVVTLLKRRRRA